MVDHAFSIGHEFFYGYVFLTRVLRDALHVGVQILQANPQVRRVKQQIHLQVVEALTFLNPSLLHTTYWLFFRNP